MDKLAKIKHSSIRYMQTIVFMSRLFFRAPYVKLTPPPNIFIILLLYINKKTKTVLHDQVDTWFSYPGRIEFELFECPLQGKNLDLEMKSHITTTNIKFLHP